MFYYLLDKDKNILAFDEDKKRVENLLAFAPQCDGKVHKTSKELVYYDGNNCFAEDVKEELLVKEKERKLEKLKDYNKEKIYKKYSATKQFDIMAGIGDYGTVDEMREFINFHLNCFNTVKDEINAFEDLEKLKEFDEVQEYERLIGEEK